MKIPQTVWNYSLDTETDRIAYTITNAANRFFTSHGFYVLPYPIEGNSKTIFLPDLHYELQLFDRLAPLDATIPLRADTNNLNLIKTKLEKSQWRIDHQKLAEVKKIWSLNENKLWEMVSQFFKLDKHITLEIRPTRYGSACSFDCDGSQIRIFYRVDTDISHLGEAIISAILLHPLNNQYQNVWQGENWTEKEAIVDSLMTVGPFAGLFPGYNTTLSHGRSPISAKLNNDSKKYLAQFGITDEPILCARDGEITIKGKQTDHQFSMAEKELLLLLIDNKNKVVSFDEIADIIWKDQAEEKYSLWAMAKMIQRLRGKLQEFGVNPDLIETKRRVGYVLADL